MKIKPIDESLRPYVDDAHKYYFMEAMRTIEKKRREQRFQAAMVFDVYKKFLDGDQTIYIAEIMGIDERNCGELIRRARLRTKNYASLKALGLL